MHFSSRILVLTLPFSVGGWSRFGVVTYCVRFSGYLRMFARIQEFEIIAICQTNGFGFACLCTANESLAKHRFLRFFGWISRSLSRLPENTAYLRVYFLGICLTLGRLSIPSSVGSTLRRNCLECSLFSWFVVRIIPFVKGTRFCALSWATWNKFLVLSNLVNVSECNFCWSVRWMNRTLFRPCKRVLFVPAIGATWFVNV